MRLEAEALKNDIESLIGNLEKKKEVIEFDDSKLEL